MTGPDGHPDPPPRDLDGAPGNALPPHSSQCMGCGPDNSAGLAMQVRREGDDVVCEQTFDARQVGAPGLVHGGAVAAACDDLFGFVLYLVAEPAVTRTLEVGYRRPVRLGVAHHIRARLERRDGRKLHLVAEGTDPDGVVCFEARAVFVIVALEHFTRYGPARFEYLFGPAPTSEGSAGLADDQETTA